MECWFSEFANSSNPANFFNNQFEQKIPPARYLKIWSPCRISSVHDNVFIRNLFAYFTPLPLEPGKNKVETCTERNKLFARRKYCNLPTKCSCSDVVQLWSGRGTDNKPIFYPVETSLLVLHVGFFTELSDGKWKVYCFVLGINLSENSTRRQFFAKFKVGLKKFKKSTSTNRLHTVSCSRWTPSQQTVI